MSSSETTVITDNMDDFFGKLNSAVEVVTTKLIDVAPEAAEALLNLVQFKGIFEISVGFLILAISLISFSLTKKAWKWAQEIDSYSGEEICLPAILSIVALFTFLYSMIEYLLVFYNWISVFYPEGAIALKALEAAGISL